MRLSEAIMLGSVTGPQVYGTLGDRDGGTCAIGAAYKACGIPIGSLLTPPAAVVWRWLRNPGICPVCDVETEEITFVITNHLNDTHKWTREKIAEWVARIEPAELPANVTCEATVVRHCEDSGELCGKTCVEGSYLCEEHHED